METSDALGASSSDFDGQVRAALARLPGNRFSVEPPDEESGVLAWTDLTDADENSSLLTLGARFDSGTLRADVVHNQLFFFPPTPTSLEIQKGGSPEELVSEFDEWLREIVSRDAFRDEWMHRGRVFASTSRLDGYGDLIMMFNRLLAPRGLERRLLKKGSFQGKGWVKPRGIGTPDRSTKIRVVCQGQD